jgi:uncharacterized protein (TIGR02996 family)
MTADLARGFLKDICANPDDDTPRLVFADWLSENGDEERAEFIRVQIERTRLPSWDARQVHLKLREWELLTKNKKKWKNKLPRLKGVSWGEFRRGFMGSAKFTSFDALRDQRDACWAATPIELAWVRWPSRRQDISALAPIAGLRELSLAGIVTDVRVVAQVAASPLLSTLRVLGIPYSRISTEGFTRLVASPHLGGLKALRASGNDLGNAALESLRSSSLEALEELDLMGEGEYGYGYGEEPIIDADGVNALTRWPGLARLRSLNLSGHNIRWDGLRLLLQSPRAVGLKELGLRSQGLTIRAMQQFANADKALQLDVLDLGWNLLDGAEVKALGKARCVRELKVLRIDRCELSPSDTAELAKAKFIGGLRWLNADHNSFGPEGTQALLEASPESLHTLHLENNGLGDGGAAHLVASPTSDSLLQLDLSENRLTGRTARALGRAEHLKNLLVLRLTHNRFDAKAVDALRKSPLATRLASLRLEHSDGELPF